MEIKATINKIYILLESVKGLQNQFVAEILLLEGRLNQVRKG